MLRIYGSSMSPFVRKVLAFCSEKGIQVDSRPVGLGSDDPDFRMASPFGKMPAMIDGSFSLADSSAILHYLEAKQPDPPLVPAAAEELGKAIWFEEFADTILAGCIGKLFFNRVVAPTFLKRDGDLDLANKAEREELPPVLAYLEGAVTGREFLVGDRLTIADIAVASCLANLEHSGVVIKDAGGPVVASYAERMLARPSFAPLVEKERAFFAKVRS